MILPSMGEEGAEIGAQGPRIPMSAANGGSSKQPIMCMLCIVYIGIDSPNIRSRNGGKTISLAVH